MTLVFDDSVSETAKGFLDALELARQAPEKVGAGRPNPTRPDKSGRDFLCSRALGGCHKA